MRAKGLLTDNAPIVGSIAVQVRVALGRLEDRGLLVRIISAPDAWWALAKNRTRPPPIRGAMLAANQQREEESDTERTVLCNMRLPSSCVMWMGR